MSCIACTQVPGGNGYHSIRFLINNKTSDIALTLNKSYLNQPIKPLTSTAPALLSRRKLMANDMSLPCQ